LKLSGKYLSTELKEKGYRKLATINPIRIQLSVEIQKLESQFFYSSFLLANVCETLDPVDWWKSALKISLSADMEDAITNLLILPASLGSIERCFSSLGRIMTKQRNRLRLDKAYKLCTVTNF